MKNLTEKFLSVLEALNREGVDYVLIGGFAVVLHGSNRMTEDIDICIRNNEENVERLRKALYMVFKDDSIEEITVPEIENYSVIRYGNEDNFTMDIIGNLGEAFSIENIVSEQIEVDGVKVRIATLESLYKMKEKTYRPIDQIDLIFLAAGINAKGGDK